MVKDAFFFCQTLAESLKDAAKLLRDGNATEAAKLLRASKSSADHFHIWQEVSELLAEAEFKLEHYRECLAVGRELQSKTEQKSEVSLSLRQTKERTNGLSRRWRECFPFHLRSFSIFSDVECKSRAWISI